MCPAVLVTCGGTQMSKNSGLTTWVTPRAIKTNILVETERTPIRDRLPDHWLRCYKHGTLAPDDDRSMTNRPVEALG